MQAGGADPQGGWFRADGAVELCGVYVGKERRGIELREIGGENREYENCVTDVERIGSVSGA